MLSIIRVTDRETHWQTKIL